MCNLSPGTPHARYSCLGCLLRNIYFVQNYLIFYGIQIMDNKSNNKLKSHPPYSENSSSRDGTCAKQWQESNREHRRDHAPNPDRGQDGEWNRDRPFRSKSTDSSREGETFREEQAPTQTASFPAYDFTTPDHSYVDNNRRALSMICYNTLASANVPWNPMDAMPMNTNPPAMPIPSGMDMAAASTSVVNPYALTGLPAENMYGAVGMGNYCQYGMMGAAENITIPPTKEIIRLTNSVLYPPNPNAPRPTTRGKPLYCKTVFVSGLPEKASEDIIKEIFDKCGNVESILPKKKFCHSKLVRFSNEVSVENAICFSGYRIKIENKEEPSYTGRLYVDYAHETDDQYDCECQLRLLQRQARHQEQDYYRSLHYTEHKAEIVTENLRSEETFPQASHTLINWLEKGECNKRNSANFYSMLQNTNSRARQIGVDKIKDDEKMNDVKKIVKSHYEVYLKQLTLISKIHKAVSLQKVWDQFTKAQRKNIEGWKKQAEEMKNVLVEKVINEREDEEMELSEDENEEKRSVETFSDQLKMKFEEEVHKLREEADSSRCELETLKNQLALIQSELKCRDTQIASLRIRLHNSEKEC